MIKTNKKFIIITSIFNPTDAVKKFSKIPRWTVIIVGDKKTPLNWKYKNIIYLSPSEQLKKKYKILKFLPWNHYARKMVGYLHAMEQGAEIIYDTDDDNAPLLNWKEPSFRGNYKTLKNKSFINTYQYFTSKKIWPRGLPLTEIINPRKIKESTKISRIGIWQFLANGDPDVDAIYRLTDNSPVLFKKGESLVLEKNTFSLINSQNTFFKKESFPLLYLPAFVTFRFTDILRGIVAQPIIWSQNLRCGFGTATVIQERNDHDYLKDFESEIPMYLHSKKVAEISQNEALEDLEYTDNLMSVYLSLKKEGIVTKKEIDLLRAWIADVKKYNK